MVSPMGTRASKCKACIALSFIVGIPRGRTAYCLTFSVCKHVEGVELDTPYASMHVLPVPSSAECPRFLRPLLGFSCQHFPSLVERRELCRYTSRSADVARLSPCSVDRP